MFRETFELGAKKLKQFGKQPSVISIWFLLDVIEHVIIMLYFSVVGEMSN